MLPGRAGQSGCTLPSAATQRPQSSTTQLISVWPNISLTVTPSAASAPKRTW